MDGVQFVKDMVDILVAGITNLGSGLAEGINSFVTNLAITTTGTGNDATQSMSVFLVFTLCFCGISLAIGITRHVFYWLESLSARG